MSHGTALQVPARLQAGIRHLRPAGRPANRWAARASRRACGLPDQRGQSASRAGQQLFLQRHRRIIRAPADERATDCLLACVHTPARAVPGAFVRSAS